ncbi:MAG: hypothetical protein ABH840_01665 [Nanoarchaeota archaeon]
MGLIRYLLGYRTCNECHKEGHKSKMIRINVYNGLTNSKPIFYHETCSEKYFNKGSKARSAFSTHPPSPGGLERRV